jgi:transcriptional regulator with XRE-family HTH domain
MVSLEHLDHGTQTRLLRVAARLSQHELAVRAGIDRRRLSEYELNQRPLNEAELARLRAVLDGLTLPPSERHPDGVA